MEILLTLKKIVKFVIEKCNSDTEEKEDIYIRSLDLLADIYKVSRQKTDKACPAG